jgi:nitroreductase
MVEARIAEDRIAFLRSLRAVRSFRPDPVPGEVVDDILEVARWSGSASVLVMAGERPAQETYDEGRLAERVMLAALAHGVGSSVGWIVGGGRDATREILVVPEGRMVRTAISLGYPDERAGRRRASQARKPLSEIVHEERYG